MASKSNDVSLIIKARDEASSALNHITDALKDLAGQQDKVAGSAGKTGGLLGQLGREVSNLNAQMKGVEAFGKIAGELDRAGQAVARLDGDVKKGADGLATLARESKKAETNTAKLRGQLETETRVRNENTEALKAAKRELAEIEREIRNVTRAQERANKAVGKEQYEHPAIAGAARSAARSASVFMGADLDQQRTAQAQLNRDIATYETAIRGSREQIKALGPVVAAAAQQESRLATETRKAAGAFQRQREELSTARSTLSSIQTASQQATGSLSQFATTQDRVAEASARMAAQMAAAKARIDTIKKAAEDAEKDAKKGGGGIVTGAGDRSIETQRRAVLEANREWVKAQDAVKRLAVEMRNAAVPTAQMGDALGRAQAMARLAKQEYDRQAVALHRLGGAAQSSFAEFYRASTQVRSVRTETAQLGENVSGAVAAQGRLASAVRDTGRAMDEGARSGTGLRGMLGGLYGESRQAMSIFQRLRGEVLSLVTAYVGLHAAVSGIGSVIQSFRTMEAAQSRLGVVFNQDTARVAQEITWLNSEAARLGISFKVLSDEYGKFAVAANAANFTAADTRTIFTRVAEAARVNKLSMDQMSGVFLALQQMISKGKVSSEELRRQLGDRLTGAFNIFASAIGVSAAQLDNMLKKGEVLSTDVNMLKFAEELNKRFGPQLASALMSVTVQIDRFGNSLENAQRQVGEGGFAKALGDALAKLNDWFASSDAATFFHSIGQALAGVVRGLAVLVENFGYLKAAMMVIVAIGFARVIQSIVVALAGGAVATTTFGAALGSLGRSAVSALGSLTTLSGVVAALRVGVSALLGVLGGIPGILLAIGAYAFTSWVTGVDTATSALSEHQRIMSAVQAAYKQVGKDTDTWADKIRSVNKVQAQANLDKQKANLEDILGSVRMPGNAFGSFNSKIFNELNQLVSAFGEGEISVEEFKKALDRIAEAEPKLKDKALEFSAMADKAEGARKAIAEAEAIIRKFQGTATAADDALLGFGNTAADVAKKEKTLEENLLDYAEALEKVKAKIPEVARELKRLKEIAELDADFAKTLAMGPPTKDTLDAYNAAKSAIDLKGLGEFGKGAQALSETVAILKKFEGFIPYAKYDMNAYRTGYGSDTTTRADGSVARVTKDTTVSEIDALRDLVRRIGEFQDTIKREIGSDRFGSFNKDQQAVITSLAYNYGNLSRTGISDTIRTGSVDEIANAIRGLGAHNAGINRNRRNQEADIFASGGTSYEMEQRREEIQRKYNEGIAKGNEQRKFETQNLKEGGRQQEINKAIRDAELKAQENGLTLTKAQRDEIAKTTGALYDQKHAKDAAKESEKEAKEAVEKVNKLYELRNQLLQQQKMFREAGNYEKADALNKQLEETNKQLFEAIDKATKLQKALGGTEADTAIAKMQTQAQSAQKIGVNLNWLGLNMQQMQQAGQTFASTAANAFDTFAQAIGEGQKATVALRYAFLKFASDFLRQIAQMIIQQAILNMLQMVAKATGNGFFSSLFPMPTKHTGGIVGGPGASRMVDPNIFANALSYHSGGIAGLKPDEVPTILKKNEEVLTEDDPRHRFNGGAAGRAEQSAGMRIINAFDTPSFLEAALDSRVGEKAILNFVRANSGAFKAALG